MRDSWLDEGEQAACDVLPGEVVAFGCGQPAGAGSLGTPLDPHHVFDCLGDGVQLWTPEAGGRVDFRSEHDEKTMTELGLSSKREVTRTSIRVRTAMMVQTREQGRYLGGRPPYGYRLADAGPHPNKAHAAWGRRAHRLDPDPATAHVVRWIFAQRLAGHSVARIARALNEAGVPCPLRRLRLGSGAAPVWRGW